MAQNHINYLSRDFDAIRADIVSYAKQNYPQLSPNFGNDTSVTSFLVDALSDCVDNLNYHIDRTFQDTQVNSSNSRQALMNIARSNGLKVPGPKGGMCEVKFSCVLKAGDGSDISQPKWSEAPVIQRNCVVGSGNISFTIDENVDFREQFNADSFSNRTYEPSRDANGQITGYTVTKSVVATAGQRRVYKKILSENDVVPFMEVMLPDSNVMNVESIIFKANSNLNSTPEISEYYVNSEKYQFRNGAVTTYRYFETESLVDQWRWSAAKANIDRNGVVVDKYNTEAYDDYKWDGSNTNATCMRIYKGGWVPVKQKFITEYTDNGYLKIIFGPGTEYKNIPSGASNYAQYRMCSVMNNDMLGVLPKAGWTMYILYNVGGGVETNLAVGAINTIKSMQVDFPDITDSSRKSEILNSITVTNTSPSVTGKDAPTTEELKYFIKYNNAEEKRCVSVKDYEIRTMMMPPKFGSPFRCSAAEENNKIMLSVLGLSADGSLEKAMPKLLMDNIVNYLTHYKTIGDYVEIKSGKIYNIGLLIDAFIDKSYNAADVIASIIKTTREYFNINNHDMGEDIFIGDLYKEIGALDGVIGLIDLKIYKITNGGYSTDECPLPSMADTRYAECNEEDYNSGFMIDGANVQRIDIDAVDSVLLADSNAMYEIKNHNVDIKVRVKQK